MKALCSGTLVLSEFSPRSLFSAKKRFVLPQKGGCSVPIRTQRFRGHSDRLYSGNP